MSFFDATVYSYTIVDLVYALRGIGLKGLLKGILGGCLQVLEDRIAIKPIVQDNQGLDGYAIKGLQLPRFKCFLVQYPKVLQNHHTKTGETEELLTGRQTWFVCKVVYTEELLTGRQTWLVCKVVYHTPLVAQEGTGPRLFIDPQEALVVTSFRQMPEETLTQQWCILFWRVDKFLATLPNNDVGRQELCEMFLPYEGYLVKKCLFRNTSLPEKPSYGQSFPWPYVDPV